MTAPSATGDHAPPVAVISGGSSGIGLALARRLRGLGYTLFLLARDETRLAAACAALGPERVSGLPLDVADADACKQAIEAILAQAGRIDWLITSAGTVTPGMFHDLDLAAHRRQMEVNYFGTLNLVHPVVAAMRRRRAGRVTLIASAAAFCGVVGYSGYGPGKFAVRGLGEILRMELAPEGIDISVAFPPDTDTPQLAAEAALRPPATQVIAEGGGILSPDAVAAAIIEGALANRFMIAPGRLLGLFGWVHSLYAPLHRRFQGKVLRQLTEQGRR